jgi:hypothetical protein
MAADGAAKSKPPTLILSMHAQQRIGQHHDRILLRATR